jgi:hypothetical protein
MSLQGVLARRPSSAAVAALIGAAVTAACLAGLADGVLERLILFYGATSLAYALMPYTRRGDIPLVAMWVVLATELAPLAMGRLLAPRLVAADIAGVLMAAGPIYIARARQVMQGDMRPYGHNRRGDQA